MARKPYPSDVSAEDWALVAPYLALLPAAAGRREHPMREVFNALRWLARGRAVAAAGERLPTLACGLRPDPTLAPRRLLRAPDPRLASAVACRRRPRAGAHGCFLDSRTPRSTPESGHRAGYDGAKRKRGSKVHAAVDTLGHLLALHVTPADTGDRAEAGRLAAAVQEATGETVGIAFVDQGCVGQKPAEAAAAHGIQLEVVKLPEAKRGFVLLPRRWIVERSFAWATQDGEGGRLRRLRRDAGRRSDDARNLTCTLRGRSSQ